MDRFAKWFITSFVLGLAGLLAVIVAEHTARLGGELNQNILLGIFISIFVINLLSLISIVLANSKRAKRELVASAFIAAIPLLALVMNGFLFTVYFGGK